MLEKQDKTRFVRIFPTQHKENSRKQTNRIDITVTVQEVTSSGRWDETVLNFHLRHQTEAPLHSSVFSSWSPQFSVKTDKTLTLCFSCLYLIFLLYQRLTRLNNALIDSPFDVKPVSYETETGVDLWYLLPLQSLLLLLDVQQLSLLSLPLCLPLGSQEGLLPLKDTIHVLFLHFILCVELSAR